MSKYDRWKTTTPEDEENERDEQERRKNKRTEQMIDDLEAGDFPDYDEGPYA